MIPSHEFSVKGDPQMGISPSDPQECCLLTTLVYRIVPKLCLLFSHCHCIMVHLMHCMVRTLIRDFSAAFPLSQTVIQVFVKKWKQCGKPPASQHTRLDTRASPSESWMACSRIGRSVWGFRVTFW